MSQNYNFDEQTSRLQLRGYSLFPDELLSFVDKTKILDVSGCSFVTFEGWIDRFSDIEVLFASNMKVLQMPDLTKCRHLRMVGMKSCQMTSWQKGMLPQSIEAITLTDNELTSLPEDLPVELPKLKKLMLSGNKIISLPEDFSQLQNLEILRLADNQLSEFPEVLRQLNNLKWYVDSGNPYNSRPFDERSTKVVQLSELQILEELGSSSKNKVHWASYKGNQYAFKEFGVGVTTDGSPISETLAAIRIQSCPQTVITEAIVVNENSEIVGVLMQLLPDTLTPLALPPDLHTLTLDVYGISSTFSQEFVANCLSSVKAAVAHLHQHNVAHGDIYAHNILVDKKGNAVLVDFGSATIFDESLRDFWESIENRALEMLEKELATRIV